MKTMKKTALCLLLVFLVLLPSLVFAEGGEDDSEILIKDYEFISEDSENPSFDAPQSIKEGDMEYELSDITYEVIKEVVPNRFEKDVTIDSLENFNSEIKEMLNGKEVVYKAEEPRWEKKERSREKVVLEENRIFGIDEDVPTEITIDGNTYLRDSITTESIVEPFTTPAYFASSDKESTLYFFNGKLVEISSAEPVWTGWKEDILSYLNLNPAEYHIDSIRWNGGFTGEDGNYLREAVVSGTQPSFRYSVTYVYDSERDLKEEDIQYSYSARVTYVEQKEPSYEVIAHATYLLMEKPGLTVGQKIGIGAGVAIVACSSVYLVFFLGKKKKKVDEQVKK